MQQTLPELPAWLAYVAGFVGLVIAGVLGKLGLDRGKSEKSFPERSTAQVAAVVVDSQSLERLTAAIEAGSLELMTTRKTNENAVQKVLRAAEDVKEEIERHRKAIDRHGERIADHR